MTIKAVKTHPLMDLILIGLALRLFLSPLTSHLDDVVVWYITANDLLSGGLDVDTTKYFSYPPLWAYTFYPFIKLVSFFVTPSMWGTRMNTLDFNPPSVRFSLIITSPFFNIIFKLPLIIADAVVGIIIYDFVKELRDEKRAMLSFNLWFFNPLVIWISSIHGMYDVLPALMTLIAFYFLYKQNYLESGIALSLGVLYKLYPIYLLPLYLSTTILLEREKLNGTKKLVQCLKFLCGLLIPIIIFFTPLIGSEFFHAVFTRTGILPSIGGLTPWQIARLPTMEWLLRFIIGNASFFRTLVVIGTGLSFLISLIFFLRAKNFLKSLILGHITILVAVYMTSINVNPQHILWILPFLILAFGLYDHYLFRLNVLSLSALMFGCVWIMPLYPLSLYTPLLDFMVVSDYWKWWLSSNVRTVSFHLSGNLGWIILISCLIPTFGRGKKR